jgi:predicted amidohydrolase
MNPCGDDLAANQRKGEAFCEQARDMGADIAVFPEMWSNGYHIFDPSEVAWREKALGQDDDFITSFKRLARKLGMAIVLTYLEKWDGAPRNSLSVIDRNGDVKMVYAKVHTCDFDREIAFTPGDDFHVCDLETGAGTVKIGTMICYDREFPESARVLMLKGAELILVPNACTLDENRIGQFRARAYENMVGVAMANYAAPRNNGHSVAFDGVAYTPEGDSRDTQVVLADEHEGVVMARFDIDQLRHYRSREGWGNAFRKPHRYQLLTSDEVREPFIRNNGFGEPFDRLAR